MTTAANSKDRNAQCPEQRIPDLGCYFQCYISTSTVGYHAEFNMELSGTIPACNSVLLS